MPVGFWRTGPARVGALGVALMLVAGPARGQVPQPEVPDINQRSGLLMRFEPIEPHLPPDPRRDTFYDTRFADRPREKHPNGIRGGGLYGLFWRDTCSASIYPYFYGAPGQDTICPDCRPWKHRSLRVVQGLVQPFRPVGMYYDQGSYVPIRDLDPLVPGPGPYPIPWYPRTPRGG